MNTRIEELYKIIQEAQDELKEIRNNCPHKNYKLGNYMWAPGHINEGYICEDCGEFLGEMKTAKEWIENPMWRYTDSDFFYKKIKEKLYQKEFEPGLMTWDKFEKISDYSNIKL